jgi:sigma-B regulation protein RsbU (phosphoserine phosphatase)
VGDVSGKGVPAALIMATTRSGFRIFCETSSSPAKIVEGLNNQLCHNNETCIFVTAFVGVIDIATRQLTYCNAGHNPAAIANSTTNSCQFLNVDANLPLGVAELQYTEQQFTLTSDTTLLLYTDGLTEAERSDSAQYGNQQLLETMATLASKSSKEIIESLHHSVTDFAAGAEQSDDLTILCIKLSDNTTSF